MIDYYRYCPQGERILIIAVFFAPIKRTTISEFNERIVCAGRRMGILLMAGISLQKRGEGGK